MVYEIHLPYQRKRFNRFPTPLKPPTYFWKQEGSGSGGGSRVQYDAIVVWRDLLKQTNILSKAKKPSSTIKRSQKARAFIKKAANKENYQCVCVQGLAISRLQVVSTFVFQLLTNSKIITMVMGRTFLSFDQKTHTQFYFLSCIVALSLIYSLICQPLTDLRLDWPLLNYDSDLGNLPSWSSPDGFCCQI